MVSDSASLDDTYLCGLVMCFDSARDLVSSIDIHMASLLPWYNIMHIFHGRVGSLVLEIGGTQSLANQLRVEISKRYIFLVINLMYLEGNT